MTDLEKHIKQLADDLLESITKKKRPYMFDKYLREWSLTGTSDQKEDIKLLFEKYDLEAVKSYDEDFKFDITELDKYESIVVKLKNIGIETEKAGKIKAENTNRPIYTVSSSDCPKTPYDFQEEAYRHLNDFYNAGPNKRGLLVLPTGSGKTFTSVSWLLRHAINNGKKVIWTAHRHELLEQVNEEIGKLCYTNFLPNRTGEKISTHLISGSHDRVVRIDKDDDFIIASIQTLNRNLDRLYDKYLKYNEDVFLVIDEAHHATAKTYRSLIEKIESSCPKYNLLGLTATPFRTAEEEKSYLAKIFDKKPIYSRDLNDLIIKKILAVPKFIPVETNLTFSKKDFDKNELELLQSNFDLPEKIKQKMVQRKDRDRAIVRHYTDNKDKYKKTLVFALDRDHAIQLDTLFRDNGIKTNYVISGTRSELGITIDKEHNNKAINSYRKGELETLVNVNILTEGTDLPKTQTIFLTRPTKSKTLMTQMVGRALRGPKANGTKDAYIVSFIDDWSDLVAWQSPEELFVDENDITDTSKDYKKVKLQFISIKLLQQFARLADKTINTEELESYPAIMRIPIGWYSFEKEIELENEDVDYRSCKILVYEQHKPAFDDLEENIEGLYRRYDYNNDNNLDLQEREDLLKEIKRKYFDNLEFPEPSIQDKDLKDLIDYYDRHRAMPNYFIFEERDNYDISLLVNKIYNTGLSEKEKADFIRKEWKGKSEKSYWRELFNKKKTFKREIEIEFDKLNFPEDYEDFNAPVREFREEELENLPLSKWPPALYKKMRNAVFDKWNQDNPDKKIEKKDRRKYQIDHIKPMNKDGKTVLENLQPLSPADNMRKGDKWDEE